ncbi:MAG: 4Fe-4S binding protein [Candidatus Krumholzibacteriia bacterium]
MKRQIITIDEDLCTGCGLCIPNCPEGALQIIDGKARLVSDLFCDGLGACIGHCPEGAIATETREAEPYDESKVMENIVRFGPNVIKAHIAHLRDHKQDDYFREALAYLVDRDIEIPAEFFEPACRCGDTGSSAPVFAGCPGSRIVNIETDAADAPVDRPSRLRQWPVQIMLVPPSAPFLDGADLLVAADCVPFAYAGFHENLLAGKVLLIGCPKLDDAEHYLEKLTAMFKGNDVRSVTVAHMEVPCCTGLVRLVERAIRDSGKDIPFEARTIGIKGTEM